MVAGESESRVLELGRSYYRLLFGLPPARVQAILSSLIVGLACLSAHYLGYSSEDCVVFLVPFVQGVIGCIADPLCRLRRILGLTVILLLTGLACLILGGASRCLDSPALCVVSPGLLLVPLVVYALSSGLRAAATLAAEVVAVLGLLSPIEGGHVPLSVLAGLFAATTVSALLLAAAALALAGEAPLVRALLRAWLDDDYRLLESLLSSRGRVEHLPLLLTTYRLIDGKCIGLLVPRLHYGPFRGAGSSTVPYKLYQESGGLLLALHSSVDHEHDLAKASDAARIAGIVLSEYERSCRRGGGPLYNNCCIGPGLAESGSLRAYLLPSNTLPLIIIERPGRGIDDFVVENGYPVVDAHNELARDDYRRVLEAELDKLIGKVFESYRCSGRCNCRIGYSSLSIDEDRLREYGVCGKDVVSVLFDCDDTEYFFVVFFSNNSMPGASDCARKVFAQLGVRGTIVTIDDHYCVGLRPGESERVLQIPCSRLAELIHQLYYAASSSKVRIESVSTSIIGVEALVLGDSYKYLLSLYKRRYAILLPFASILLSLLTPLITSILID